MKARLLKLITAFSIIICCAASAQDTSSGTLTRDRNVPPPEWNVLADELNERAPSVKDILGRTAKVYQGLNTYQDHTITLRSNDGQNAYTREESMTQFDRAADKSRFEYWSLDLSGARRPSGRVIWQDKDQIKVWKESNKSVNTSPSIVAALSDTLYRSERVAFKIPAALIAEVAARKGWTTSAHKYRIGDISENDISYFRIQAMTVSGYGSAQEHYIKTTYWIRKEDGLLIRVVEDTADSDLHFKSYVRTDYKPTVNEPIPASAFAFGH